MRTFLVLALLFVSFMYTVWAEPLSTVSVGYDKVRVEADEDATVIDLAADGGAWQNRPSGVYQIPVARESTSEANAIVFAIAAGIDGGGDPDNKLLSWRLFAWKDVGAPAEYVANGTATVGTQDVYRFPDNVFPASGTARQWCDTIVISAQRYIKTVASSATTGSNEIAKLSMDTVGYKYWYWEISSADGTTGSEAGDVSVWATWF